MPTVHIKRVYEPATPADGFRVLVDRLWPRGLTKAEARIDLWAKDVAPSTELRQWFHADRSRWPEFERRYRAELKERKEALTALIAAAKGRPITLLYAAKPSEHTHASVLQEVLTAE